MCTNHPIIVAQLAYVDKSLCRNTVWCKLAAIKFCFSTSMPWALGPKFCQGNITTIQSFALQSIELFPVSQRVWCSPRVRMRTAPSALVCDGGSWWRSTMPWPAVSSVYEECHHGWQPSRSMIYTLPIATGTCREVTTCLRRSAELFQARGVLDASRRNDTVWCLKFNSWNTVQTFARDAFQTCLSSDKEAVLFTTVHSVRLYTPVQFLLQLQCHHLHENIYLQVTAKCIFVIVKMIDTALMACGICCYNLVSFCC